MQRRFKSVTVFQGRSVTLGMPGDPSRWDSATHPQGSQEKPLLSFGVLIAALDHIDTEQRQSQGLGQLKVRGQVTQSGWWLSEDFSHSLVNVKEIAAQGQSASAPQDLGVILDFKINWGQELLRKG